MAVYLTPNTQFKPFSYQEMLAPVLAYKEAYDALETEMSNLDIMTNDISSKLTQSDKDASLRKTYEDFNTEMQSALNDFYDKGFTSDIKKRLAGLKSRYAKELNPINEAYKAYQEDQKYIDRLSIEHPELIVKNNNISISDYMNGSRPNLSTINTNELRDEALKIAEQQSSRTYYQDPNWISTAGGRALERSTSIGLSDAEFSKALLEIQSGNKSLSNNARLLKESIDSVLGTVNTEGLSDSQYKQIYNSIIGGTRAGFKYKKDTKVIDDPMFAHNLKTAEEDYKQQLKAREEYLKSLNNGIIPTENIDRGSLTQGKYLKEQDNFVKSLVTTSQGVSTANAEAKKAELAQLQAELETIKNEYGVPTKDLGKTTNKESIPNTGIGGYAGLAGSMTSSSSQQRTFTKNGKKLKVDSTNDVAYNRYFEIQKRLSELPSEIQQELDGVSSLIDKYGHLSSNLQEAITKGHQLELNQSSINGIYVKPILDPTLDNKVKTNIIDIAKGMSSNEGAIKEVTKDGEVKNVNPKEITEILSNSSTNDFMILTNPTLDNTNIPNPVVLRYTNTGKQPNRDFILGSATTLNNFANDYKKQVSFIRDYSKEGVGTTASLPIDSYTLAIDYGIAEGSRNTTIMPETIKNIAKNTKVSFGNNRFGYTIETQASQNAPSNIYKIITELGPYGEEIIVGVSSLNNEASVYGGGVGSGTFARTESQGYINDLIKTLQKN